MRSTCWHLFFVYYVSLHRRLFLEVSIWQTRSEILLDNLFLTVWKWLEHARILPKPKCNQLTKNRRQKQHFLPYKRKSKLRICPFLMASRKSWKDKTLSFKKVENMRLLERVAVVKQLFWNCCLVSWKDITERSYMTEKNFPHMM